MLELYLGTQPFARRPELGASFWYIGSLFTFLTDATEPDVHSTLLDITTWKGGEPPRHLHRHEDEAFYILEGEVTFYVGDHNYHATSGTLVVAPRNIPHSFTVETTTARMLELITPGTSVKHFRDERFSVPAHSLTLPPRPAGPPDVGALIADLATYGIEVVGPPGAPVQG